MGEAPTTDAPTTDAPTPTPPPNLDPSTTPPAPPAKGDDEPLGEPGKKALDAERKARRDAEARLKELEPLAEEARKRAEADKSETTKLNEALNGEREARTAAERDLLRYTVAADKGVPANLVKFLSGTTKEEVEQSATELLTELGTAKPSMPGRPAERLSDGRPSKSTLERDDPVTLIRKGRGEIP